MHVRARGILGRFVIITLFAVSITGGTLSAAQETEQNPLLLAVLAVTSSSDDGNIAANTLDGDLETRWSAAGDGQWIQVDLGGEASVLAVSIAWHNGDERSSTFDIQVSSNGADWQTVFSGQSSGGMVELEPYVFDPVAARYVRIVGHGNTDNNWNSIAELRVFGDPAGDQVLPIAGVSASGDDGNVPSNTLDGDLETRWSAEGDGEWIQFDLYGAATISAVDVAWFKGNQRASTFDVQVSTDGATWETVYSGESSGDSLLLEHVAFDPVVASHVRIVGHGNTEGEWNSITELRVFGSPSSDDAMAASPVPSDVPAPVAVPPAATPVHEVVGQPAGENPFGISMVYPSATDGEEWFMDMDHADQDPRLDPQHDIVQNEDGSWQFADNSVNEQVRINVFTSSGYHEDQLVTDNAELAERGYMQDPRDWRNVEITGYIKIDKAVEAGDEFTWYARGGHHNDDHPCEGSSYKGVLSYSGTASFSKEQWHVSYAFSNPSVVMDDLIGHGWVGLKVVMYNVEEDGETHVRLQIFLDEDANNQWVKVYDMVDAGGWGDEAGECGAENPDQIMTWGGPIATFRWDSAEEVAFKWLSVREIEPPQE